MERLDSWKAIADYLGVTVRTAQKWERQRGLPVRRLPGPRSPVSADIAELESWRTTTGPVPDAQAVTDDPSDSSTVTVVTRTPSKRGYAIATALVLLTVAGIALRLSLPRRGNPTSLVIEHGIITAVTADGRTLWRRGMQELDDHYYEVERNRWWVGDLDGDGRNEVLFAYARSGTRDVGDVLYCFNSDGSIRWQFTPGRPISTATEHFSLPFAIDEVAVVTTGRKSRIVLASHHMTYYPAQVVLLSPAGSILGEYWHSGHLNFVRVADLDHDGKPEVYLAGVDNGLHAATLIRLDPDKITGTSAEPDSSYALLASPVAREQWRLLFPRGCLKGLYPSYNIVDSLRLNAEGISVGVREDVPEINTVVMYDIAPSGHVKDVTPVDAFYAVHRRLANEHAIDHQWSVSELENLRTVANLAP